MTTPIRDKDGKLVIPSEADVKKAEASSEDQEYGILDAKEKEPPSFSVSRSDFIRMLQGEQLFYGPLKRMISIQDGPFEIVEDGAQPHKIMPPEPIEFRTDQEEYEYVYAKVQDEIEAEAPNLTERIENVLQNFVRRVRSVFRGGEGSGHFGHEGRPGEVGGSLPSGETSPREPLSKSAKDAYATATFAFQSNFEKFEGNWLASSKSIPQEERESRPYEYYSIYRPVTFTVPGDARVADRNIYTSEPIPFETLMTKELAAVNPASIGDIAKKWYENEIGETGTYVFGDNMALEGFVVHPSTLPEKGAWRATHFSEDGFLGHDYYETVEDALSDNLMSARKASYKPRPGLLERLVGMEDFKVRSVDNLDLILRGGEGSGHHGHKGRPGEVGGSLPSGVSGGIRSGDRVTFPQMRDFEGGYGQTPAVVVGEGEKHGRKTYDLRVDPDDDLHGLGGDYWAYADDVALDFKPITRKAINDYIKWGSSRYNEYRKADVVKMAFELLDKGETEYGETVLVFSSGGYTPSSAMTQFSAYLINGTERYIAAGIGDRFEPENFQEMERVYFVQPGEYAKLTKRGGFGSGHFGHAGRPGEVGGSRPSGSRPRGQTKEHVAPIFTGRYEKTARESEVDSIRKQHLFFIDDEQKLPPLGSQEFNPNPMVWLRFFNPYTNYEWYPTEYDRESGMFYGWISGMEPGMGYFDRAEIGEMLVNGVPVYRDRYFEPKRLGAVKAEVARRTREALELPPDEMPEALPELVAISIRAYFEHDDVQYPIYQIRSIEPEPEVVVRGPLRRIFITSGGEGSGHFDHAGRPGEVGGSQPSGKVALPKTRKIKQAEKEAEAAREAERLGKKVETGEVTGVPPLPVDAELEPVRTPDGEIVTVGWTPETLRFGFNENLEDVGQIPEEDVRAFLAELPTDTRNMDAQQRWDLFTVLLDMPYEKLTQLDSQLTDIFNRGKRPTATTEEQNYSKATRGLYDVNEAALTYLGYMNAAANWYEEGDTAKGDLYTGYAETRFQFDLYGALRWAGKIGDEGGHLSYFYQDSPLALSGYKPISQEEQEEPKPESDEEEGDARWSGGGNVGETAAEAQMKKSLAIRGGEGSGHKGHRGRPGEVGGSQPSGAGRGARPQEGEKREQQDVMPKGEKAKLTGVIMQIGEERVHFDNEEQYEQINQIAEQQAMTATEREPALTELVQSLAATHGAELHGLDFKTKSQNSIIVKIRRKMLEDGLSLEEASQSVNDTNRYTLLFDPISYVDKVKAVQSDLAKLGWTQYDAKWKNYWSSGDDYDGYNTIMVNEAGERFEIQYHTPESAAMRAQSHIFYNQLRAMPEGNPELAGELYQKMVNIFATDYDKPINYEQLEGVLK